MSYQLSLRTSWRHGAAILLLICAAISPIAGIASDVDRPKELDLDYKAFDQDLTGGWRRIASDKKYREAAELIDRYIAERRELPEWQRVNLRFHAGQLYAFANDKTSAVNRFKSALYAQEPPASPVKWNAYVLATIAFLEEDRSRLLALRAEISKASKCEANVPNLDVVDRLIQHFGKSYAVAYAVDSSKSR